MAWHRCRRCERTAICATGAAAIAAVCAHPALLQLDVQPPLAQYVAFSARVFLFLGLAGGTLALARRHRSDRPPRFCAMYGLALLFPLPDLRVQLSVRRCRGHDNGARFPVRAPHGSRRCGQCAPEAAGRGGRAVRACRPGRRCSLNLSSHLHGDGQPLRLFFGVYLGLLAAHFVVDAGMWRLREPFVRAFLSERVGYLISPAGPPDVGVSVADRSVADIESMHGSSIAAGSNAD